MVREKHCFSFLLWLLVVFFVLCWGAGEAIAVEKVAYRLKWLINASTAGDVFALEGGFFSQAELEVEVKAGGPERDAIRELEMGYAQFGVASSDQVIRAVAKGAEVMVLAQLFQINPLQWIYRSDAIVLSQIQDLAGKTVGITYGGNDETIMRALLAIGGLDENKVRLAGVRYDYTAFFQKRIPIWPVYRNTQGIILADKLKTGGEKAGFFNPSQFGVRFVANSVVTSKKLVDKRPELVARFTQALLNGWKAAMEPVNEMDVVLALAKHDRDTPTEIVQRQLAATRKMIQPDPKTPLGKIDTKAWLQTEQIMVQQKLISAPVRILKHLTTGDNEM
jgi:NitT/TauT family transport system substrate-binding protein